MGQQAYHGPLHRLCCIKHTALEVCAITAQQAPSDLILQKTISLTEALTGLNFHVRHLDGRVLQVGFWHILVARTSAVLPPLCFRLPSISLQVAGGSIRAGPEVRVPLERCRTGICPRASGRSPSCQPAAATLQGYTRPCR